MLLSDFPVAEQSFFKQTPQSSSLEGECRRSMEALWSRSKSRTTPTPPYPSLYNCNFWRACVELQPALVPSRVAPGQSPRGCPCSTEDREWTSNSVAWSGCGMIYRESLRRLLGLAASLVLAELECRHSGERDVTVQ